MEIWTPRTREHAAFIECFMYLDGTSNEVNTVTYISDNEAEENVVYLTNNETDCLKWNSAPDLWQFAEH